MEVLLLIAVLFCAAGSYVPRLDDAIVLAFVGVCVALHTLEEIFERFWRYYYAHFGRFHVSDRTGAAVFVALGLGMFALSALGVTVSPLFMIALAGAMAADVLVSHVGLRLTFHGPNPGIWTAAFLYAPAVPILLYLYPIRDAGGWLAFAAGAAIFVGPWAWSFLARKEPAGAPA